MATDIDHDNIKEQIVLILQADSNLYDATGADSKVRQINVEQPDDKDGLDTVFPSIYVKNANPFETTKKIGSKLRGDAAMPAIVHEFRYDIVMVVEDKDARTAINRLDDFKKLALQALEADARLKNGGAALVDDSIYQGSRLFSERLNGQPVQGQIITLLCRKVTV